HSQLKTGRLIFTVTGFSDLSVLFAGNFGALNKEELVFIEFFESSEWGFNSVISPAIGLANTLKSISASESGGVFLETTHYLTLSVQELSTIISEKIKNNEYDLAEKYISRAKDLLLKSGDFNAAGDYQRWLGFIKFKESNFKLATRNYQEAIKLHTRANQFDKVGDDYKDLANISEKTGDLARALEFYNQASLNYGKVGKTAEQDKVLEKEMTLRGKFTEQIKELVDNATSEQIPLDFFVTKTKLKRPLLIEVLVDMIAEGVIPGQIDETKGRYLKKALSPEAQMDAIARMKAELVSQAAMSEVAEKSLSDLTAELDKTETEMEKWERTFEQMNLPLHRYLEYQEQLERKNFIEHQIKILEANKVLSTPAGVPTTCMICLKPIQTTDPVTYCQQNHPAHTQCLAFWLERQKKCPVCESDLLPSVLQSFPQAGSLRDEVKSRDATISQLKAQIQDLQSQVQAMASSVGEMTSDTEKDQGLFQKLVAERQEKSGLLLQIGEKEKKIKELEALVEEFK
ncbi:MAG: RING finger domain-containing protein, partial [Promethearchaeota archaeon]